MSVNDRIRKLRQKLGLSQAKFAKDISISNGYIAAIELGNRNVNDRIIRLICTTYHVNEAWLKTGEGDMLQAPTDLRLEQAFHIFKDLKPEFQDYVLKQISQLLEVQQSEEHSQQS